MNRPEHGGERARTRWSRVVGDEEGAEENERGSVVSESEAEEGVAVELLVQVVLGLYAAARQTNATDAELLRCDIYMYVYMYLYVV